MTTIWPTPAIKLVPWEGFYIFKGRKIKVYFDLRPDEELDPNTQYVVNHHIGTIRSEELYVLGCHIITPKPLLINLEAY